MQTCDKYNTASTVKMASGLLVILFLFDTFAILPHLFREIVVFPHPFHLTNQMRGFHKDVRAIFGLRKPSPWN